MVVTKRTSRVSFLCAPAISEDTGEVVLGAESGNFDCYDNVDIVLEKGFDGSCDKQNARGMDCRRVIADFGWEERRSHGSCQIGRPQSSLQCHSEKSTANKHIQCLS